MGSGGEHRLSRAAFLHEQRADGDPEEEERQEAEQQEEEEEQESGRRLRVSRYEATGSRERSFCTEMCVPVGHYKGTKFSFFFFFRTCLFKLRYF